MCYLCEVSILVFSIFSFFIFNSRCLSLVTCAVRDSWEKITDFEKDPEYPTSGKGKVTGQSCYFFTG